jgi:hypothetical protein
MMFQYEDTRHWLAASVPNLVDGMGSTPKRVALDILLTYVFLALWRIQRVISTATRMNYCLDTRQWSVYERREEHNELRPVLSFDMVSVTALEGKGWRHFSVVREAIISLQGGNYEGRKLEENGKKTKSKRRKMLNVAR